MAIVKIVIVKGIRNFTWNGSGTVTMEWVRYGVGPVRCFSAQFWGILQVKIEKNYITYELKIVIFKGIRIWALVPEKLHLKWSSCRSTVLQGHRKYFICKVKFLRNNGLNPDTLENHYFEII